MHFLRLGVRDVVLYDPLWWVVPGPTGPRGRRLLTHYRRTMGPTGSEVLQLQPQETRAHLPFALSAVAGASRRGRAARLRRSTRPG